jgi:hypothetical protein
MMTFKDFFEQFPDEQSCLEHFVQMRLDQGLSCRNCGEKEHLWVAPQLKFKCRNCSSKRSYRSGTVMQGSKLPLLDWYTCMFLMSSTRKAFSACEMQRQLGRKRYEPVFRMMHRIRSVMGQGEAPRLLVGEVELDDSLFRTVKDRPPSGSIKRGRGSQLRSNVLVGCESDEGMDGRQCRYFTMHVLDRMNSVAVNASVSETVSPDATVISDSYSALKHVGRKVGRHDRRDIPPKEQSKVLPWVHTAISNAKRNLLGIFHRIDHDYLQCYLDELIFKLNGRFANNLFDRLMRFALMFRWNQFALG